MKIKALNLSVNNKIINPTEHFYKNKDKHLETNKNVYPKVSSENYKANFLPFSGNFKTVGSVEITDRRTGDKIPATIKKNEIKGEYIIYKLYKGKKELGYLDMSPMSDVPKKFLSVPDVKSSLEYETFPEIEHIRTIDGDKYSGIGSSLVKMAIEESKKYGYNGALWAIAEKGFQKCLSPYRSDENPLPFYYKLGFRAFNDEDEKIRAYISGQTDVELPETAFIVLSSSAANSDNEYLRKDYTLK